jgi:4'-phosphopantetheinyl transferase
MSTYPPALEHVDMSIALTSGQVHLWLMPYGDITDEQLSPYWFLLDEAEKEKAPRFHFARDRRRYVATRALVRMVLSRYASLDPKDWLFCTNPYGRPEIANPEVVDEALSFNISHTHSLIVLGVTRGSSVGVDVENIFARAVSIDIANRFFNPEEAEALSSVPKERQQYRFFEYWTFKEAYIKARGMGLSLPLEQFCIRYPNDCGVGMTIAPELKDDAARWQLWQFRPFDPYLVAVCAERPGGSRPDLVVRLASLAGTEMLVTPTLLRASS